MYKQIKGKVMKNNAKSKFPYFRLVIGSILGTLLMHITSLTFVNGIAVYSVPLIIAFIFSFILGFIPMFIAFRRKINKREFVYWLSFVSMFIPFGILIFFISLILSVFCKNKNVIKNGDDKTNIVDNTKCNMMDILYKVKIKDMPYKILNMKIILSILLVALISIFCCTYISYEEEALKLKIYNLCMKNNDSFFEDMDDYIKMELSKTNALENARKTLDLACDCENKAIALSISNPYKRLKYMKNISLSYNHWQKYYKRNDVIFYNNYKRIEKTCVNSNKNK